MARGVGTISKRGLKHMKRLEPKIKLRGLGYHEPVYAELMFRTGHKAMYRVKHLTGHIVYEVFSIRKGVGKYLPSGAYKPAGELYPSNDDFGKTAWCISNLERALERYIRCEVCR